MKRKQALVSKVSGGFHIEWKDDTAADDWDAKNRHNMMGGSSLYGERPQTDGAGIFTTKKQVDQFLKGFFQE